jgi:apolipoprotein N-acyltransferase
LAGGTPGARWPRVSAALPIAVAAGAALGASFVDFRLWLLPWVAVAALIALAERRPPGRAFVLGYAAGIAGVALAFSWLLYAVRVFGGFSTPLALLIVVAPVAWMALEIGLFMALLAWLPALPLGLGAPVAFTAVEFLFPSLFPWRLAHSQYRVPTLLQSGELAGPFLLGFAMVWASAALARLGAAGRRTRRDLAAILLPLAFVGTLILWGSWRRQVIERERGRAPLLRVALVQGNVSVIRKGNRAYFTRNLDDYRRLSRAASAQADLLVWPETVVQRHIVADHVALTPAENPFTALPRPLLFGGLAEDARGGERAVYNSALLIQPDGRVVGRYDKRLLVPFGEYMPLGDRFPRLRALSPATGNFRSGNGPRVLDGPTGARLAPLICYEDVVPEPTRAAIRDGATLLINLTNDAWYGNGAEPRQHQALAIWRAVESRRDFVRATNTGLTSVITAAGAVTGELPTFHAATLVGEVRLLSMRTFYSEHGDVFAWGVVALALAGILRRGPRRA